MTNESESRSAESVLQRYWNSVWIERDLSVLGDLYTDPTIRHTVNGSRTINLAKLADDLSDSLRAMRGESFTIDQLTVVDDIAWLRLNLQGISLASMTPIDITWMAQYRIESGRIAETWALHQANLGWPTG